PMRNRSGRLRESRRRRAAKAARTNWPSRRFAYCRRRPPRIAARVAGIRRRRPLGRARACAYGREIRNVLAIVRGFHAKQYQILRGGVPGQSRRIRPLQNISSARRRKDIEAAEFLPLTTRRTLLTGRRAGRGISRIPKMPRSSEEARLYFTRRFPGGAFGNQ